MEHKNLLKDVFLEVNNDMLKSENAKIRRENERIIMDGINKKHFIGYKPRYRTHSVMKPLKYMGDLNSRSNRKMLDDEEEHYVKFAKNYESKIIARLSRENEEIEKENSYKKALRIGKLNSLNLLIYTNDYTPGEYRDNNEILDNKIRQKFAEIKSYFDDKYHGKNEEINSLIKSFEDSHFDIFSTTKKQFDIQNKLQSSSSSTSSKNTPTPSLIPTTKPILTKAQPINNNREQNVLKKELMQRIKNNIYRQNEIVKCYKIINRIQLLGKRKGLTLKQKQNLLVKKKEYQNRIKNELQKNREQQGGREISIQR